MAQSATTKDEAKGDDTSAASVPTAAIVVIGDEILSGKTPDTNTPFLIQELRALGVALRHISVVPDVVPEIAQAVAQVHRRYDHVFTSGGVGPTHDDVTIDGIAAALGRKVVRSQEIVAVMNELWQPVKEAHLRMADMPEGAELLYGAGLRFPLLRVENIYIFPGVPEIFRDKFLAVRERFRTAPFHLRRVYSTYGEGHLTPLMNDIVAAFPSVAVGSYPTMQSRDYRVLITLESKDERTLHDAATRLTSLVGEAGIFKID